MQYTGALEYGWATALETVTVRFRVGGVLAFGWRMLPVRSYLSTMLLLAHQRRHVASKSTWTLSLSCR